MDISANTGAEQAALSVGQVALQSQIYVKKKSEDIVEQTAMTLLSSVPQTGSQPLATSGTLGTRFNAYA
ncbi:hypothetical protein AZ34_14295 [Hylemonella gracilis str. Niagara R]|jgi:hypothetical protein|uniref:Motility protein n=1 Tax=Hylemonella gracilis str. Niagara R TaxID=1458275 RepID=A0A016XLQ3_9BURK|nr:hypothetical protein [Hylemonella gracilis]EYC52118.1 hypothetical protein AZ34_14295 [Hylemonella gracilis str. Niagara R]